MIRRLVETLIIEAFEAHKLDSKIKGTTGEFFSLRDLIKAAQDESWNLGRISKPALVLARQRDFGMGDAAPFPA